MCRPDVARPGRKGLKQSVNSGMQRHPRIVVKGTIKQSIRETNSFATPKRQVNFLHQRQYVFDPVSRVNESTNNVRSVDEYKFATLQWRRRWWWTSCLESLVLTCPCYVKPLIRKALGLSRKCRIVALCIKLWNVDRNWSLSAWDDRIICIEFVHRTYYRLNLKGRNIF